MTLSAGTRLGPYEIVAPLGAGGMGEVYRAKDSRLGREVAVKVLPPEFVRDPERIRRFKQEAKAAEAKKHAEESVAKGRAFVAAYVELTHYVERLHADATSSAAPHAHGEPEAVPAGKH